MKKEFVTYELALKLKELGFDEPCFGAFFTDDLKIFPFANDLKGYVSDKNLIIGAPLFQQAFRWFREKYELFHSTNYQDDNSGPGSFDYEILDKRGKHQQDDDAPEFDTYEEAELACLEKLIEIVETKR